MDQRELVERAKRGDHDAFAQLVDPALARLDAAARSRSALLLDPAGGPWTSVPWQSDLDLDWQRLALEN